MDYRYYSSGNPHQAYHFYGLENSQHPQPDPAAAADQFQDVPPVVDQFQTFQQPFEFSHPVPNHHPIDVLPPEPFRSELFDPPSHDSSEKLTDSSNVHPSTATENSDEHIDAIQNGRSSSEEKDNLTPAQSRRKAQNRAAQRAFRERKERRVRDLEQELSEYKQNVNHLLEDNECLKREIAKVATENEILRATSTVNRCPGSDGHDPQPLTTGPMTYSPTSAPENDNQIKPIHRIRVHETTGEKLLDASATWDLIVSRLADEDVKVDVQDVYNRLKGHAVCDGSGPVLEETRVRKAIEESIAAGSDRFL